MDAEYYAQFLLANLPVAKFASGRSEIVCRCQYCADSKNPNKGHFYISIPKNENDLSFFHCKKCGSFGMVTHNKLIEWGIYDPNIAVDLQVHNKNALNNPVNFIYKRGVIHNIKYNHITDDKLSRFKLKYINDRLGLKLDFDDCLREKIILNLSDLLGANKLELTRHPNIIEALDCNFVGFLSHDNSFVNMRNLEISDNLYEGIDRRYINYNLFKNMDNTNKFYAVPNNIDIMRPVDIHIAEGPFDILSVYHNIIGHTNNQIFTSIGGNRYKGMIKYLITNLGIMLFNLHFYVDNDVPDYIIEDIAILLEPFQCHFYIHRNRFPGEKDYGVPSNKITNSFIQLM